MPKRGKKPMYTPSIPVMERTGWQDDCSGPGSVYYGKQLRIMVHTYTGHPPEARFVSALTGGGYLLDTVQLTGMFGPTTDLGSAKSEALWRTQEKLKLLQDDLRLARETIK